MIATCVHVWVKPEYLQEFIEITLDNHTHTIKEAGNLRFDVLQDTEDTCKFTIYEVFSTAADIDFHKETEHYKRWRDTVASMMEKPRQGIKHMVIAPATYK